MIKKWREARRILALVLSCLLVTAFLTVLNPSAASADPVVTSLNVTSGTTLGGTVVTITGTGLASTTAVTFGGTAGTSIVNTSATQISVTTPAHAAGLVDLVITSGGLTSTVAGAFTFTLATLSPPTSVIVTPNFNVANGYYLTVNFTAGAGAITTRADLINNATGLLVGTNNFISNGSSFTGLLPNTSYTVNLYSIASSATYTNGQSGAASSTVTTTTTAPAAISWGVITLSVGPGSVPATQILATVSAAPTGATYYRYTLYASDGTFIRVIDVNSLSNTFVGLTPGTTYKVSVKAYGNGVSYLDSASDLGPISGSTAAATILTAPTATVASTTADSILFSYSGVTGAVGYRATLLDSTQSQVISTIANATTGPMFTGLTAGASYYLSVIAVGDGITYITSAPVIAGPFQTGTVTSLIAPSVSATVSGNTATVSLSNNSGLGVSTYTYFVYDSSNRLITKYTSTNSAWSIYGLTYGASYSFDATQMLTGYAESPKSATQATVTIGAAPTLTTLTTPATPTYSTTGTALTGSSITASVAAVANVTSYLWFLYDSTGTTVLSSINSGATPSQTFSGLNPSSNYSVAVMALGTPTSTGTVWYSNSVLSSKASVTTAASTTITTLATPTPVVALSTSNPTATSANVTFSPTSAGTYLSYTLKLYDASGNVISTIPYFTSGTVINGLQPNTGYSVTLTAIGDGVNYNSSSESGKVAFTTKGSIKIVPVEPTVGVLTPQSAILNFSAPTGVVSTVARLYDANSRLLAVVPGFTSGSSISAVLLPSTSYKASLTFIGNGSTILDSDESTLVSFATPAPITIAVAPPIQTATSATGVTFGFTAPTGAIYCRLTIWDSTGSTVISRIGQYANNGAVAGLLANTAYKASIKCFGNGVGYLDSPESPLVAFSTGGIQKLLAPTISQVVPTYTGNTLTFVSQSGTVSTRVKIYDSSDNLLQSVAVANTTTFAINSLVPNTTYKFSVTAIGNGATILDSDEGDKFIYTTAPVGASMLPMPTWTSTANTVTVVFNETLLGYTAVRLYNSTGSTLLSTLVTSGASVNFPNLLPGTQYQISLVALANGYNYTASTESSKVIVQTTGLYQVVTGAISSVTTTAATGTVAFSVGTSSTSTTGRLYAADGTTLLGVYPGIATGYVVGGLAPQTTYYFTIQAIGNGKLFASGRESAKFAFTTAAPNTLLAPTLGTTGTITPTSIAVVFTPTTGSVSTTLRIYSRSTGQLIATIPGYTSNAVINNPITPNSSYAVTLQAIGNGITTITSDESSTINIATPGPVTLFAPPVTNTVSTPNSVTVGFTAQAGAVSWLAKLYSADGQTLLGSYGGYNTGTVFSQLQPNTTYQVSVTAIGNGYSYLTSPESQRVTVKTSAPITMATPSFTAYSLGGTSVGLQVNAVVGANTYTVKTYSADGSTLISVLNVTTNLTPIGGLSPNTTYQFSVTAVGNGSSYLTSPESPRISATTSSLTTALPSVPNQAWVQGMGGFGGDSGQNSVLVDSSNNVYVGGYFVNQSVFGSGSSAVTLTSAGGQDSFLAKYAADGTLLWVQQSGGTGNDYVNALAFDATGNVVVTGVFQGVSAFGQSANRQAITAMGGNDSYIAKYAPDGTFAWVRQLSGTVDEFSRGVATDRAGNIFVTGYFTDNISFGTGTSKVVLRTFGGTDGFLAKYAANGNFTWVKQFGGLSGDQGNGIAVDRNGNVFIAGSAATGAVFGTGSNSKEFLPESGTDAFIAKFTNDGDFTWLQAAGGTGSDQALAVATDASGSAYLVGTHAGAVFGTGADVQSLSSVLNITNGVTNDGFLAKYDSTGRLVWVRNMGGQAVDQYNSVAVDASGNIYAGGQFNISAKVSGGGKSQTLVADGSTDGLVAKYNSDGTLVWARALGGASVDAVTGVGVGSTGALAVTGYFSYDQPTTGGVSVFSLGDTAVNLTSAGNTDTFVALLQTGSDVISSTLVAPVPQINEIKSTSAAVSFALQAGAASYTLKLYDSTGTALISTITNYIPGRLITGLSANTSYKVTLTAMGDGASTITSAESAKLTLTTALTSTTPVVYNIGADQALISFAPVAGATSYSLQVYDSTGSTRLFTINAATPAATWIYYLLPGTTYKVAVKAFSDGQSNLVFAEGSLVSFTTAAATTLANPVATQSASTATTVTINIPTILVAPQMIAGNRGWLIRTYAADGTTLIGAFATTTATNVINGLNPATTYKVSVTALGDGIQYLSSAEGVRVLVSTAQATVAAAPTPIITQITADTLAVNFAPIPALVSTSYIVRINGFTYVAANSGAIYATGVLPNSSISVSMQAIGDGTNLFTSSISTPVTLTTPTQPSALSTPNVAVTSVLQSSANIMPTPVVGATQYFATIYDSTGSNVVFALPVALGGTTVSNLLPNKTYKVEVVAVGNGTFLTNSNPSTQVSFTTGPAGTLSAPINLLATSVNTTSFKPTFTTVANAVAYLLKVYRADGTTLLFSQIITSGTQVNFAMNLATSYKFSVTALGDGINYLTSNESPLVNVDLLPAQTLLAPTPALSSITSNSAIVGFTATANSVSTYARIYASDGTTLLATFPAFANTTKITYPLSPNTSYWISLQAIGENTNYLTSAEGAKVAFTTPGSVKLLAPFPQIYVTTARSVYVVYTNTELGLLSARASIYSADGSQLLFVSPSFTNSATIPGLTPNTSYRIVLTGLGDGVNFTNSDPSQSVSFTTPASVQLYAPTPSVGFNGAYSFKVNFSPVTGAVSYFAKVYASDGTTLLRAVPITSGSAIFGLASGASYKLSLVSVGDSLVYTTSPESAKVSFTFAGGGGNSQLLAPTPTFSGTTSNSTIVNFDTATGANAYTLKRYTADGNTLLQTLTYFTPGTIVANLAPSTTYKFALTAIGDGVAFLNSSEGAKTSMTTSALVAASLLPTVSSVVTTSTVTSNSVTVSFPAATGASSYTVRVYAADGSTVISSISNFVSGNTITGLIASTNYLVTLTALGDGSTYISAPESTKEAITTLAPGALAAPVLTKSGQTSTSISLTFPGQSGAAGYSASLYAADGTTLLANYSPFTSGSSITGLTPNTTYKVKVIALGDGISSSTSAASAALTAVTALGPVGNIVVSPRAQTAVVQFDAISGAVSYTLRLYNSTGSTLIRTVTSFTSGATLTGLSPSTTYQVSLVAVGDGSTVFTSDESSLVSATTPAIITLAAPVVTASTATTSSVSATFAAVTDALSYTAMFYAADGTTVLRTIASYTSGQVISGLSANITYQLEVQAIGDGTNFLSSLVSNRLLLPTINQTTLSAPTPIVGSATSSAVTVTFTVAPHSISTTLKLYAANGTTLLRTITNFLSGTALSGLSSGTTYKVTLSAIGDGVNYLSSGEGSLTSAATASIATLSAPVASTSGATTYSINVNFSAVAGASSYLVKIYAADGTTLLRTVSQVISGQTISGLSAGTTYVLKFSSIGDSINYLTSADSSGVQFTTASQVTLTAPTPAITQTSATTISFAFTPDANALSTTARLYTGDGATLISQISNASTGMSFTGLTPDTDYMVTLQSIGDGIATLSSAESVLVAAHTAQPTALVAPSASVSSITSSSINLTFSPTANALSYMANIYAADGVTLIASYTGLSPAGTTITSLTQNTTYKVTLVAVGDEATYLSSLESSPVSFTTAVGVVQLGPPNPSVDAVGSTTARITFGAVDGASSYAAKVYAADGTTLLQTLTNFTSGQVVTGLTLNTTYMISLNAIGNGVNYLTSGYGPKTTFATAPPEQLLAPTITSASSTSNSTSLSFSTVTDALDYAVKVYASDGSTLLTTISSYSLGSLITGLSPSTTYVVSVSALGDGVSLLSSSYSTGFSLTTQAPAQLTAPSPSVFSVNQTSATIVFTSISGASSYAANLYAANGSTLLRTITNFSSGDTVTGLSPNTTYQFAILAGGDGISNTTSAESQQLQIDTLAIQTLNAPTAFISGQNPRSLVVSFSPVDGAVSYTALLYAADGITLLRTVNNFTSGGTLGSLTISTDYQVALISKGDGVNYLDSAIGTATATSTIAIPALFVPDTIASATGTTTAVASFSAQSSAQSFQLIVLAADGTTVLQTVNNFTSGSAISGLSPSTTYGIAVRAIADGINYVTSDYSSPAYITTAAPVVLSSPNASVSGATFNTITVSFSGVSNSTAYVGKLYNSAGTLLRTITSFTTGTTISGLTAGATYQVAVIAVGDVTNYLDSPESTRVTINTGSPIQLAAPTFTTSSIGQFGFQFGFTAVNHGVSYNATLYASNGATEVQTWTNISGTTTVTSLSPNTRYYLSLTTVGDSNYTTSNPSAQVAVTTQNLNPLNTTTVSTSNATFNSIVVTFAGVTNAVSYTANVYTSGGNLVRSIAAFTSGSAISGLTVGTNYLVGVVAVADNAAYLDSPESVRASFATTAAVQLSAPMYSISGVSKSGFQFSFISVSHAVSYSAMLYAANGTTVIQSWTNIIGSTTVTGLSPLTTYKLAMTTVGDSNYLTSTPSSPTSVTTASLDALSAPTASASSANFNSIVISFSNVSNASSYTAKLYTAAGSLIRTISSFTSGSTISGLTAGTNYFVGLTAVADQVTYLDSPESTRVSFATLSPVQLSAPTYSVSAITYGGFQFAFNSISNAVSYNATLYVADGTTVVQSWTNVSGTTTVSGLSPITTYKLSMTAVGNSNYLTSSPSSLTSIVTLNLDPVGTTSVTLSGADFTSIVVTFTSVPHAVGYTAKLYAANGSTLIRTISNFASGSTISGLSAGTDYDVSVIAVGDSVSYRDGAESSLASFTTVALVQLQAPTIVVSTVAETGFTIDVTAVPDATGYTVTLYASNGTTVVRTLNTASGVTSITGLSPSTNYVVTVIALGNDVSNRASLESAPATVTTLVQTFVAPPAAPPVRDPVVIKVPAPTGISGSSNTIDLSKIFSTPGITNATASLAQANANVSSVSVVDGKIQVKTPAYFSGKTSVKLSVIVQSNITFIETTIVVQPQSISIPVLTARALAKSSVHWFPSSNATYYQVVVNGRVICETVRESCAIDSPVGPKTKVVVVPFSEDGVAGSGSKVSFGRPAPLMAASLSLGVKNSKLSVAEKIALRDLGRTVNVAGFTKIILVKPLSASPAAKAKMLAAQLLLRSIVGKSVAVATEVSSLGYAMDIKVAQR